MCTILHFNHKIIQLSKSLYVSIYFCWIFQSLVTNHKKQLIMKSLLLTIALPFIINLGFSQDTKGQIITVTVENAKSDTGKIIVTLNTKDTFLKAQPIKSAIADIKKGKATVTFENVQPGEYAILALHDLNGNQSMDFQANGMPKESYGTSNNSRNFGPPLYEDAKFIFEKQDMNVSIRF